MRSQELFTASNNYTELDQYYQNQGIKKIFLVCDESIRFLKLNDYFDSIQDRLDIEVVRFCDFQPNPLYESVEKGVKVFLTEACDSITAIGGGSAMDVAKCIKLFSNMNHKDNYLRQTIVPNQIPFIAVPTTAGTGSESTRFAVIYYKGEKQSVADISCIPGTVLIDKSVLKTLPLYQKKSTLLDALCHSLESYWSINSTDESKQYSDKAIREIIQAIPGYLNNEDDANERMMYAANTAGKAINITQTTAGHAMCYKLTSLYKIAHGHAAALVNRVLFPWMLNNTDKCVDPRGEEYLKETFGRIANAFGCNSPADAADKLDSIISDLQLEIPKAEETDYEILRKSVNPTRLKNNPVKLDEKTIDSLYHRILR